MNEVDKLRASVLRLHEAAAIERIEPGSTLGVWIEAQEIALKALADVVHEQNTRLLDRVEVIGKALSTLLDVAHAETSRLKARSEASRQQMLTIREDATLLKEERLKATDDMAVRLSDKIQKCLETTMLVRERRWNLRQNLGLVAVGFGLLFSAFLAGEWTQGHNMGQDIIRRCGTHLAVDPGTKIAYCAMSTVEGLPDPVASAR